MANIKKALADRHDWQDTSPFEETNLQMLENEILCDVTFLTGSSKQEVKGHKYVLASRSPVFYAMFNGSMPEKGDVEVPDIEANVLKELFRFLYSTDCKLEYESSMALMYAAKKYQVRGLEKRCKDFLKNEMSAENVCCLFQEACDFPDEELEEKCFQFICRHSADVLESDGFCLLSKQSLKKIIASDNLSAFEIDVYKACKRWAIETSRQEETVEKSRTESDDKTTTEHLRTVLGDLIYLIRFPNIPKEVFSSIVSKENILSLEEKVEIFQYIIDRPIETPPGFKFNTRPRRNTVDLVLIKRFIYNANQFYRMSKEDQHGISFKISNGFVKLAGISIFAPCGREGRLQGKITILEGERELLTKEGIVINWADEKYFEEILFERSLRVKPGIIYSVVLTMGECETYLGTRSRLHLGKDPDGHGSVNIQFLDYPNTRPQMYDIEHTNTEQGQIHGLIVQIFD
ncbi:BTB/POZ domain-containing protein 3-like isoform X2 [Mercenaria mercenaria]|uniref:BTB/POZ domain-containing protein 3-like isoform X2 n=1 Tax=Mercenaria mercenaria TaxID=6596 RepID=UPI001E1D9E89|nr:BTB/POZ domain-containing protein 3-like isoform X2 [Mercenaria mercenaria]